MAAIEKDSVKKDEQMRFEFGKNWSKFVRSKFNRERCDVSKKWMLDFSRRQSFEGTDFLDIGCGSGLSSLAAWQAGAVRVHSFDYDPNSVAATKVLWEYAGRPSNWKVEQGDALNGDYIRSLGRWNFVYSWGVLHHTGAMWQAVDNAQSAVADGGTLYIALYSSDVQPEKEFWLEVKQKYNKATRIGRMGMVWWYVWNYMLERQWRTIPRFVNRLVGYRFQRGMDLFADIRDWLGGWPMEYAGDQETVDFLEQRGFKLANISTGEACSEFLFIRSGRPAEPAQSRLHRLPSSMNRWNG